MRDPETNLRLAVYGASLARLAGSFVHDLRGTLNTMSLNLSLLAESSAAGHDAIERRERCLAVLWQALESHHRALETFFEGVRPLNEPGGVFDFRDIVHNTEAMVRPYSQENRCALHADVPSEPVPIDGDRNGWRQVLLANVVAALENSEPDGVVRLSLASNGARAALSLEYQGPVAAAGASAEPSEPVETSVARTYVESRGGRFSASESGRDRRIQFELPLARPTN